MARDPIRESSNQAFIQAQADVKNLKSKPSDTELLNLYALYKQALFGDATDEEKPGTFDFKGKAKYNAWKEKAGTAPEAAEEQYVAFVKELVEKYGLN